MNKNSDTGPKLTLEITEEEKRIAKESKEQFKEVLKELKGAVKTVLDLRSAITEQHPTKEDLNNKYRGRLLRYRRKIISEFNTFLKHLQSNMINLQKIDDPDMSRLREILVAEVSELTDGIDLLLDLLKEPIKDDFTQTLETICGQLEKRLSSIDDAIGNQLFNHIDHDILDLRRIGKIRFNIKKRSRLIIGMLKE